MAALIVSDSFDSLKEKPALDLVFKLSEFDEIVRDSYVDLEPSIIVHYLFSLCSEISKSIAALDVKNADSKTASERLALFAAARAVLRQGLKILGLVPLDKM